MLDLHFDGLLPKKGFIKQEMCDLHTSWKTASGSITRRVPGYFPPPRECRQEFVADDDLVAVGIVKLCGFLHSVSRAQRLQGRNRAALTSSVSASKAGFLHRLGDEVVALLDRRRVVKREVAGVFRRLTPGRTAIGIDQRRPTRRRLLVFAGAFQARFLAETDRFRQIGARLGIGADDKAGEMRSPRGVEAGRVAVAARPGDQPAMDGVQGERAGFALGIDDREIDGATVELVGARPPSWGGANAAADPALEQEDRGADEVVARARSSLASSARAMGHCSARAARTGDKKPAAGRKQPVSSPSFPGPAPSSAPRLSFRSEIVERRRAGNAPYSGHEALAGCGRSKGW